MKVVTIVLIIVVSLMILISNTSNNAITNISSNMFAPGEAFDLCEYMFTVAFFIELIMRRGW